LINKYYPEVIERTLKQKVLLGRKQLVEELN
jgi:hypothetical protein